MSFTVVLWIRVILPRQSAIYSNFKVIYGFCICKIKQNYLTLQQYIARETY